MSSEATQTTSIYDVLAWLEANKKTVAMAFAAAVVIGFGVAVYQWKADQTELAASDSLLKLKTSFSTSETNAPVPATAYLKVAEQYSGTLAADRALLLAAGALFTENKYAEAHSQFSKFVRDQPQSPFAPTAAFGVAVCLDAQGKTDEALAAYQNLSVRYPNSSVLEDAKLASARIYEAKKDPASALRNYDELVKSATAGGMGSAVSEAMSRREDLLARFPNLAKTNALPALSTNSAAISMTNSAVAVASNSPAAKP